MQKIAIVLGLMILVFSLPIIAQNDCRAEMEVYDEKTIYTPVRVTTDIAVKTQEEENWRPYSHFDEERIYPDQKHLKSTRLDSKAWYEVIQIGEKTFYRETGADWTLKEGKATGFRPDIVTGYSLEGCSVLGAETIEGNRFRVLQWVNGVLPEMGHETADRGGWNKIWFYDNGRVLKKESYSFEPQNGANRYVKRVEMYKYDPDLKINPPIPTQ